MFGPWPEVAGGPYRIDVRRHAGKWSLGAAAVFASGALAAQASAADLSVTAGCYVIAGKSAPPMSFAGSGFTPGDPVLIASGEGTVDTSAKADSEGRISGRADAPTPFFATPGAKQIGLTATDQTPTGKTITARTTVNVTELGWQHGATKRQPGLGALTEKTNWSFSGFQPGQPIFGHYLYKGKQVALARFGRARPPCGTLKVRARLYPATPHHSSFSIQYDDSPAYSRKSQPRIIGPLKLTV
jgi:hypothetical protein